MRLNKIHTTLLSLFILTGSCIEPFTPLTKGYDEMLVIEGILTNDINIPAQVKISKSKGFGQIGSYEVISRAEVWIYCDDGSMYQLEETVEGVYARINNPIVSEPGKSYKLQIETTDNKVFESNFELYNEGSPVDSIRYEPESIRMSEIGEPLHGLQFSVNSASNDSNPVFLRWLLNCTYEYSAPYNSQYIWDGTEMVEFENNSTLYCWKTDAVKGIYTGDSQGMVGNKVVDIPLNFVSQYGDELSIKYSLEVVQLSISRSSYKFWFDLSRMMNDSGGLYETQPFRIRGNISCTSDPEIAVSGVFEVGGVTRSRVFAERPTAFPIYEYECSIDTIGENTPWETLRVGQYITDLGMGSYGTSETICYDCTARGGTNIKPSFWE